MFFEIWVCLRIQSKINNITYTSSSLNIKILMNCIAILFLVKHDRATGFMIRFGYLIICVKLVSLKQDFDLFLFLFLFFFFLFFGKSVKTSWFIYRQTPYIIYFELNASNSFPCARNNYIAQKTLNVVSTWKC